MQSFANDSAFMKYQDEDESVTSLHSQSLLATLKDALFSVFLRMNIWPSGLAMHYHVLMIGVEIMQVLTLLLSTEEYTKFGPNGTEALWNKGQIGWLIDVCWIVRLDRYLRVSSTGFYLLVTFISALLLFVASSLVFLAIYKKSSNPAFFLLRSLKICATLLSDLLFIPIVDSLIFGLRCSSIPATGCLDLPQSYPLLALYCAVLTLHFTLSGLMAALYYDYCRFCGSIKAKPHPRFKLLRLILYTVVIFMHYFTPQDSRAGVIIYLLVSLSCGGVMVFVKMHYLPYFHPRILRIRLASAVLFTCAAFCLLIGECFRSADSTNSSVTMLFYFLAPCLVQITHLGTVRRWKNMENKPVAKMNSYLEVELKARLLADRLHQLHPGSAPLHIRGEAEVQAVTEFQRQKAVYMTDLERIFTEASKKFPTAEWLYLWSGLLQEHLFERYILTIVQCFKGLKLATKLDSQYAFYHFRYTSQNLYKAHITDDAYEYVLFEKCFQSAQRNDEKVTMSQYRFWAELESSTPRIMKLNELAGETSYMIGVAKSTYQQLVKLNTKSTRALRMFGGFLTSLNNFSDTGQRYIQKAELEDEAHTKNVSAQVLNTLTQPLSFFDASNAVITISADFETIGEIVKVNDVTTSMFGYLKAELEGRNINTLIPSPFSEMHDQFLARFHMTGGKNVIDNPNLCVFFLHKLGYLIQGRILIKVVPNDTTTPYIMSVIKETKPEFEYLLLTDEFVITSHSRNCDQYLPLPAAQTGEMPLQAVILNFTEVKATLKDEKLRVEAQTPDSEMKPKCYMRELGLGDGHAMLLMVEPTPSLSKSIDNPPPSPGDVKAEGRPISILKDSVSVDGKPALTDTPDDTSFSEEESEEDIHDSDSDSSEGSEPEDGSLLDSKGEKLQDDPEQSSAEIVASLSGKPQNSSVSSKEISKSSRSESEIEDFGQEVNDAHSAYSSSKSMNSSMASLAQFNKSIKALISFEFRRTKWQVWRFKITLLLTVMLLIVTSAVTFQVIGTSVSYNERLSHLVNEVGSLRLLSQSLSYYIRMISLIDQGYLSSVNRTVYLQWLVEDTAIMHELNVDLHGNAGLLSQENMEEYINGQFSTWSLSNGKIHESHTSLFDTSTSLILQASLLSQEGLQHPIFLSNDRAFYVYRNGEGELLHVLNRSTAFYVESAGENLVNARLIAVLLILASVLVLLLCAGLAVIPALKTLDSSKREVWEIFLEMPTHVCRLMKGKCNQRLEQLNETANLDIEEVAEDEDAKKDKDADLPDKHDRKSKQKQRLSLAKDVRLRKIVSAKLSVFFLMSLVYFYLIYYTGYQTVGSVLEEEPVTINWASRLRQLSRSVNFWLVEAMVENTTDVGFKYVVPQGQNVGSAVQKTLTSILEMEYVENSLIFGNPDYGLSFSDLRSTTHDDLLFSSACVSSPWRSLPDCATVGDKVMMQGLHSALDMYGTLARTVLQQVEEAGNSNQAAVHLRSSQAELLRAMDEHYMYDSLNRSLSLYEDDYQSSQNQMKIWQNVLISVFSVCAVALFVLVYSPMIYKLGQETKQAWSMCSLIPQEYQEEFKYLNKVIRERRDNFVWR